MSSLKVKLDTVKFCEACYWRGETEETPPVHTNVPVISLLGVTVSLTAGRDPMEAPLRLAALIIVHT